MSTLTQLHISFTTEQSARQALTAVRKEYRVALRGACVTGPDYHGGYRVHVPLDGTGFSNAELSSLLRKYND